MLLAQRLSNEMNEFLEQELAFESFGSNTAAGNRKSCCATPISRNLGSEVM
jgi:hypothetical protein